MHKYLIRNFWILLEAENNAETDISIMSDSTKSVQKLLVGHLNKTKFYSINSNNSEQNGFKSAVKCLEDLKIILKIAFMELLERL